MTNRVLYLILLGFLLLGIVMLGLAGWQTFSLAHFLSGAERVEGEVIRVEVVHGTSAQLTDASVRFQTSGGEWTVFRTGGDSTAYLVGDRLPVVYQPGDPTGARVDRALTLWFVPAVFFLLGSGFCALPLMYLRMVWRQVRDRPAMRRPARKPQLPS